jgi:AcrR family transcriptional regulator
MRRSVWSRMPPRPGLDRRAIVGEAARLANERGLANVTFANLAQRLGVRAPSLYNHVESVEILHHELTVAGLSALAEALARAAIGRNGAAGIAAVGEAYRTFAKEHPGLYAATLRFIDPFDPRLQSIASGMMETMRAVLAPFGLDERTMTDAVRALRSLVHGFASLEAAGGFGMPQSVDGSFAWAVNAYVAGLSATTPVNAG